MQLPAPPAHALASLAAVVRAALASVADTGGRDAVEAGPAGAGRADAGSVRPMEPAPTSDGAGSSTSAVGLVAAARQVAAAVTGAAGPFAPSSYARARLLRQMHASGLLSDREARRAEQLVGVAR